MNTEISLDFQMVREVAAWNSEGVIFAVTTYTFFAINGTKFYRTNIFISCTEN